MSHNGGMADQSVSRRHFLGVAGSLALWLAASPAELAAAATEPPARDGEQPTYRTLSPDDAATYDAFAAQVMPSEPGSPGAREANVVRFADNVLAGFAKEIRPVFDRGITALNAAAARTGKGRRRFAALSSSEQVAVMRALEKSDHDTFELLRSGVIGGMFANPSYGGNANKVGWKLIGFEDRFSWQPPFGFYDTPAEAARRD